MQYQATDGARLSFDEESKEVEDHEHHVVVQERRIHGLGDEQHRDEPL